MAYSTPYYNTGYYPQQNYYSQNGAIPDTLNQFKGQYQQPVQMQPQPMQIQSQPIQQPTPVQVPVSIPANSNDIIWVQGEAGAKAYLVAPNTTVTLWDSENSTIYVKTADNSGVPSMRILDFTERPLNAPKMPSEHVCECSGKFISKEELNVLEDKIQEVMCRLSAVENDYIKLMEKPATKTPEKVSKTTKTSKGGK